MNWRGAGIYGVRYRRKPGRHLRRVSACLRRPAAVGEIRRTRPGRATALSWNEIARSLPGDDQRLAARRLQLGSQPADVRADVLRLRLVPLAPDVAQQVRAGQQFPPVDGEFAQQRELGRSEAHL